MGIKATLQEPDKATKKIEYPCLMKSRAGRIVLFTEEGSGTLLAGCTDIGRQSSTWTMGLFTPLTTPLILENT